MSKERRVIRSVVKAVTLFCGQQYSEVVLRSFAVFVRLLRDGESCNKWLYEL